jgi:hypothetical protein
MSGGPVDDCAAFLTDAAAGLGVVADAQRDRRTAEAIVAG